MTRTLALVESPAQLLNLLEWALGERDGAPDPARCEVAVLLPRDATTRHQLGVMTELARAEGIRVALHDIRRVPAGLPRALAALAPKLAGAGRLVIGDPFSGLIQWLLPLARTRDLVLVDDGTATLELSRELLAGRPLVRWHRTGSAPAAAARASRRITPGHGRQRGLLLPDGRPQAAARRYRLGQHLQLGATAVRAAAGPPRRRRDRHLARRDRPDRPRAVCAGDHLLADEVNAERYFAHRREDPDKLRLIAEYAELEVVRPELPWNSNC